MADLSLPISVFKQFAVKVTLWGLKFTDIPTLLARSGKIAGTIGLISSSVLFGEALSILCIRDRLAVIYFLYPMAAFPLC